VVAASAEHGHSELVRRIRAAGERWKRRTAGLGAVRVLTALLVSVVVLVALDTFVTLPFQLRTAWLSLTVLFMAYGLVAWVGRAVGQARNGAPGLFGRAH
jgi:hypothetical protein